MKYVAKPVCVDAVQLKSDNLSDLQTLLPDYELQDGERSVYLNAPNGDFVEVLQGEWIIKGPDGRVFSWPEDSFSTYYSVGRKKEGA